MLDENPFTTYQSTDSSPHGYKVVVLTLTISGKNRKVGFITSRAPVPFYTGSTVVIPTGHVHQPIFYEYGPPALNYAGIGMTLGHEFMHAFDVGHLRKDFSGSLKR
ncbi:hypothetical protein MRX96_040058 [Rhipicephalus microplus]